MKFVLVALAIIAAVAADVSEIPTGEYLPPAAEVAFAPTQEYLAPVSAAVVDAEPAHVVADDGYRYKTIRRLKYRHRRDVSELPTGEYLPPVEQLSVAPTAEYLAPVAAAVEAEPAHIVAEDGYRYKTIRRLKKYRHRRDVSELPTGEYLPPVQQLSVAPTAEYLPPVAAAVEAEPAHIVAEDGYRYKTIRRLKKYRHRRDVSELPTGEYLPPVEQAPSAEYLAPVSAAVVDAEPAHALADDGYRYKTIRRLKYRHRRDVSELPTGEYLPPVEQVAVAPTQEYLAPVAAAVEAEPAHVVAEDGYRYKTIRRLKYRHRRDVSELPTGEYLPPVEQYSVAPTAEYLPPVAAAVEAEPAHIVAEDGYRYKTIRRLKKYRHRRDVSELPTGEYLPPVEQAPSAEYLAPVSAAVVDAEPAHALADDGYRYKTIRRLKYRHRRELPTGAF